MSSVTSERAAVERVPRDLRIFISNRESRCDDCGDDLGRHAMISLPAIVALTALAIPPIVVNTYAGLRGVDRELIEAARGMGMRASQVVWGLEVPVALPVILAGIRTSAVQVVATATLAGVIGGGTLGELIIIGFNIGDQIQVFGAALVVAAVSIATELSFAALHLAVTSPGLRGRPIPPPEDPGQMARAGATD